MATLPVAPHVGDPGRVEPDIFQLKDAKLTGFALKLEYVEELAIFGCWATCPRSLMWACHLSVWPFTGSATGAVSFEYRAENRSPRRPRRV